MIARCPISTFLNSESLLLDCRSEGEFEEGHISGAINFPLLNNSHRSLVGTAYKRKGKDAAIRLGFELVNPLRDKFKEDLELLNIKGKVRLYCARGGLRSSLFAGFLAENGIEVELLINGYKSYRNYILKRIQEFKTIRILSGYTGSGKTKILEAISEKGGQVLNLEALAKHKGSAFGALGEQNQPSSANFHHLIFDSLKDFHPDRVLWVENESVTIGKVSLPLELWRNMQEAPGFELEIPLESRVKYILSEYGRFGASELTACVDQLKKRLGDEECRRINQLIRDNALEAAAFGLMRYYDKAYLHGRKKRKSQNFVKISFKELNFHEIADYLLAQQSLNLGQMN